jgi:hypothetical protein
MKKTFLTLGLGLMAVTAVHAQQSVVIERPGVLTDLASATVAIISLPLAAIEGVVVGAAEAASSLVHGSTQIVIALSAKPVPNTTVCVPAPVIISRAPAAIPTTTIVTTHGDGTVTTVTRYTSAYELGPVIGCHVGPGFLGIVCFTDERKQ